MTLNDIYKKRLNEGYIHEGLYRIYSVGEWKDKENPTALVTKEQDLNIGAPGIFERRVEGVFRAIIAWDNMDKNDRCPITMIGTTMIVEPIKLYGLKD